MLETPPRGTVDPVMARLDSGFHRTFTKESPSVDPSVHDSGQTGLSIEPSIPTMFTTLTRLFILIFVIAGPAVMAQDSKPGDPFIKAKGKPAPAAPAASPDPANAPGQPTAAPEQIEGNMLFTFETYALPQEALDAIHEEGPKGQAFHDRVRKLVADGKATLESLIAVPTRSGQRATSESVDEVLYATEFDPAVPGRDFAFPTAYEMRPTGERIELDPVLSEDKKIVDLNLAPDFARLSGFVLHKADPKAGGELQPLFVSRKVTTAITCPVNVPTLLGTYSKAHHTGIAEAEGDGSMGVMFVTARLAAPKELPPAAAAPHGDTENLRMVFRFYSLPRATARDLLAGTADADKLHVSLRALPPAECNLERLITLQTRSGQRASIEEVAEKIYGTEIQPSGPPRIEKGKESATPAKPAGDKAAASELPIFTSVKDVLPASFTAFEMRPVGWRIEVDPVLGPDGRVVDLNLAPEHTEHRGNLEGDPLLARYPAQPVFSTQKITTAVTSIVGHQCFLGTFNAPRETGVNGRKDDGRTWFAFVKVTVE